MGNGWEKEIIAARNAAHKAGKILDRMFGQVNHITKLKAK